MLRSVIQNGAQAISQSVPLTCRAANVRAYAVPSTAVVTKEPGFWAGLFGEPVNTAPSMVEPMAGVTVPPEPTYPATAPATEMTTLANGVRIVSENTPGSTVSVGLYIDVGSVHEGKQFKGICNYIERTAFKNTKNRSHLCFTREVESIGANLAAAAGREQMSYTADALKTHLPELCELLADTALNSKNTAYAMAAESKKMIAAYKALKPTDWMFEWIHNVAYDGGLGQPYLLSGTPTWTVQHIPHFVRKNYIGSRVVLAASGCEHKALVSLGEDLLGHLKGPGSPTYKPIPSKYTGGEKRVVDVSDPITKMVLGFECQGGWRDEKNSTVMSVIVTLMGGGGSFSAGGPGKGMHSRLYTRVLNRYSWMTECSFFQSIHNDTGIVGIIASAKSSESPEMAKVVVGELQALAAKGAVSAAELERAKKATISNVMMALESKQVVVDDMGRQVLTFNKRFTVDEFKASIEKVTAADIQAAAAKMLKTPPSLVAVGPTCNSIPSYDELVKAFK